MSTLAHVLKKYPPHIQDNLEMVRRLIHEIAKTDAHIGTLEESLKWGQLSLATLRPKSGTPIRLGCHKDQNSYSLFVSCSTKLISEFRGIHPELFEYHGTREIRIPINQAFPKGGLTLFISAALKYYVKQSDS